MKKILSVFLSMVLLLGAAGCSSRAASDGSVHMVSSQGEPVILQRDAPESVYGVEQPAAGEALEPGLAEPEPEQALPEQGPAAPGSDQAIPAPEPEAGAPQVPSASQAASEAAVPSAPEPAVQPSSAKEAERPKTEVLAANTAFHEVRGVWISYLTLEPLVKNKTKAQFTANLEDAFSNVADFGFNTVFVQVRPFGDALYESRYFPWSYLLSGEEGNDPGYDPLEIMCELADRHGLRIEAWINPYRVRAGGKQPLSPDNQAKKWIAGGKDAALEWNGGVYYNPGSASARKLIVNGVKEIVKNYNVDGIHFDDYFYPTTDMSFDRATYQASGSGKSQADWRRENVNILVREVYSAIKEIDNSCVFGISPQGNTKNNYEGQFIDCAKWLANTGYVDYICPQVYFGFENSSHPFAETVEEWNRMIKNPGIDLYVGIAAYKLGAADQWAGEGKEEWIGTKDLLSRMVETSRDASHYGGVAMYSYDSLFSTNTAQVKAEKAGLKKIF